MTSVYSEVFIYISKNTSCLSFSIRQLHVDCFFWKISPHKTQICESLLNQTGRCDDLKLQVANWMPGAPTETKPSKKHPRNKTFKKL